MIDQRDIEEPATRSATDRGTGWRGRAAAALGRARAHRTGRILVRLGVTVTGLLVILVGVVLLPLPGPGWVIIFTGLAIWSIEFNWARRLLGGVRGTVTRWRGRGR